MHSLRNIFNRWLGSARFEDVSEDEESEVAMRRGSEPDEGRGRKSEQNQAAVPMLGRKGGEEAVALLLLVGLVLLAVCAVMRSMRVFYNENFSLTFFLSSLISHT